MDIRIDHLFFQQIQLILLQGDSITVCQNLTGSQIHGSQHIQGE